jgi:hypothetical protein
MNDLVPPRPWEPVPTHDELEEAMKAKLAAIAKGKRQWVYLWINVGILITANIIGYSQSTTSVVCISSNPFACVVVETTPFGQFAFGIFWLEVLLIPVLFLRAIYFHVPKAERPEC